MKLTQSLWKQHMGRAIRTLWYTQRRRMPQETGTEEVLSSMGFQVKDALIEYGLKKEAPQVRPITQVPELLPKIEREGDVYLTYKDSNLLQLGVIQAQVLTKTVQVENTLPKQISDSLTEVPERVHELVKRIIYTSNIFDAYQEKLPKRKDPLRPSWVFPRDYGIRDIRKIQNLSKKFVQLCEILGGPEIAQNRSVVHNGSTCICIEKDEDVLQFALRTDLMITSSKLLTPFEDPSSSVELNLPDIHPMHPTIGLPEFITPEPQKDMYPVKNTSRLMNVHTVFAHNDPEEVKNITELPVTEDQLYARSMMKAFTVAVSCARTKFGDVKELPEPVTVQCIQSNGHKFHFSVFQLNTLNISQNNEGVKNFWWSLPMMPLFTKAQYESGRPVLEEYNKNVFETLYAFYKNR